MFNQIKENWKRSKKNILLATGVALSAMLVQLSSAIILSIANGEGAWLVFLNSSVTTVLGYMIVLINFLSGKNDMEDEAEEIKEDMEIIK